MSKLPSSRGSFPLRNQGDTLLCDDAGFVGTLTMRQRAYFYQRESRQQAALQSALRDLSRGLGTVNALNSQALTAISYISEAKTRGKD